MYDLFYVWVNKGIKILFCFKWCYAVKMHRPTGCIVKCLVVKRCPSGTGLYLVVSVELRIGNKCDVVLKFS